MNAMKFLTSRIPSYLAGAAIVALVLGYMGHAVFGMKRSTLAQQLASARDRTNPRCINQGHRLAAVVPIDPSWSLDSWNERGTMFFIRSRALGLSPQPIDRGVSTC
jgi:hypothetical protein